MRQWEFMTGFPTCRPGLLAVSRGCWRDLAEGGLGAPWRAGILQQVPEPTLFIYRVHPLWPCFLHIIETQKALKAKIYLGTHVNTIPVFHRKGLEVLMISTLKI